MLALTEKRLVSILWMLVNKEIKWSVFQLRKGTAEMLGSNIDKDKENIYSQKESFPILDIGLTYRPTLTFVKELEKNGFVTKYPKAIEYGVARASDLVKFISLSRPFSSLEIVGYHSDLGFSEKLKMIYDFKIRPYAFTVFAASELYRQYVKTDQVHAYVRDEDKKEWAKYLISKKCLKAEKGQANLFLISTKEEFIFRLKKRVKGFSIAPIPLLLSDLLSFGGLAEEQANFLMEEWLNNRV